jgi:hypothetical protein
VALEPRHWGLAEHAISTNLHEASMPDQVKARPRCQSQWGRAGDYSLLVTLAAIATAPPNSYALVQHWLCRPVAGEIQ